MAEQSLENNRYKDKKSSSWMGSYRSV